MCVCKIRSTTVQTCHEWPLAVLMGPREHQMLEATHCSLSHTIMLNGSGFCKQWQHCENELCLYMILISFQPYKPDCVSARGCFYHHFTPMYILCLFKAPRHYGYAQQSAYCKNESETLHTPSYCASKRVGFFVVVLGGGRFCWPVCLLSLWDIHCGFHFW